MGGIGGQGQGRLIGLFLGPAFIARIAAIICGKLRKP
jgi:hypothetical protein